MIATQSLRRGTLPGGPAAGIGAFPSPVFGPAVAARVADIVAELRALARLRVPYTATDGPAGRHNAMIESFWSSMQIELLNRQKWRTRVELANAMFDYIETFHNRQRRHSQLGYRTPIEHELALPTSSVPA